MNSPVVTVSVDADVEGAHDHEDDNGSGTNMQDGATPGSFQKPLWRACEICRKRLSRSQPSSLRDPEAESGCFHQEGKCNQVRLEAGVTRGDRTSAMWWEGQVVRVAAGHRVSRGTPPASEAVTGSSVLLEPATPAQSC